MTKVQNPELIQGVQTDISDHHLAAAEKKAQEVLRNDSKIADPNLRSAALAQDIRGLEKAGLSPDELRQLGFPAVQLNEIKDTGWTKSTGSHPEDNYEINETNRLEYSKVFSNGAREDVVQESDDGGNPPYHKYTTNPDGAWTQGKDEQMHEENGRLVSDKKGYVLYRNGIEHHWGPQRQDNYDLTREGGVTTTTFTDGHIVKTHTKSVDGVGNVLVSDKKDEHGEWSRVVDFPDGAELTYSNKGTELKRRDNEGNLIEITSFNGQPVAVKCNGAKVGREEIPDDLRQHFKKYIMSGVDYSSQF